MKADSILRTIGQRTKGGPICGQAVVTHFEVRTRWVRIRLKTLADLAEEVQALPSPLFQDLGDSTFKKCLPAWFEIQAGTDTAKPGKAYWLRTHAEDWSACVRGRRLAEVSIVMEERQWEVIREIARHFEQPTDAVLKAALWERLMEIRRAMKERGAK